MAKVGRNELCPCGSGKKYKRCCGKVELTSSAGATPTRTRSSSSATPGPVPSRPEPRWVLPVTVVVVGGLSAWAGMTVGTQGALSVAAAGAFGFGAYRVFRNPPPPNDNAGNPSGINFGH